MENYIETHRRNPDKIKVLETGEVYDAYRVYYTNPLEDSTITLMIPTNSNNEFKLSEIEI